MTTEVNGETLNQLILSIDLFVSVLSEYNFNKGYF